MVGKEELLESFYLLTDSCYNVWNWELDGDFSLLSTNCPQPALFLRLLLGNDGRETLQTHMERSYHPMILSVTPILSWVVAFERDFSKLYVKGPFFSSYNDGLSYRAFLKPYKLGAAEREMLAEEIQKLPELTYSTTMQMAVMLHYAIHQENVKPRLIATRLIENPDVSSHGSVMADSFSMESGVDWDTEQEMLAKIKKGDLTVVEDLQRAVVKKSGITDKDSKNIDYFRQNSHVLLTLISRAAVDGGMPRKSSRALCADYRRALNKCRTLMEIMQLNNNAVVEYTGRVRDMKQYAHWSKPIQKCREYIDTHLGEKITLEVLADHVGYTTYYLSRRFNEETGESLVDYVQRVKMERGAYLLAGTELSVDEISGRLGFSSGSYFSSVFRRHMGVSPSDYRRQHKIL